MPQNKSVAEEFRAALYGNGKRASVVDINDRLLGGKAAAKKPFRMAAKDGVGEIFIFDDIGEGFFSDGITPKSFAADLKALGPVRTLNIFINSPGGAVFDGVAIFNQLKRHTARKNVFIDGIAASIASVIAMAGDEINIAANGFIMIHEPFTMAFGTAADLRKTADQLEKINDSIINTYAARTGTPENVIADLMAAETWMNAEEALDLGFADNITDEVAIAAHFDLSQFQNVPEAASAALDLAKNPPKVESAAQIAPQPVSLGIARGKTYVLNEWPARIAVSPELAGGPSKCLQVAGDRLAFICENATAEYIKDGEDSAGNWTCRLVASTYEIQPWPPEETTGPTIVFPEADPGEQSGAPSLAITKMRQRMLRRGIARKDDDESPTAA